MKLSSASLGRSRRHFPRSVEAPGPGARLLAVRGVALAAGLTVLGIATAGAADPARSSAWATATVPSIERDPETGGWRLVPLGAPLDLDSRSVPGSSTSDAGLEILLIPGGGDLVDLQGRFQSYWVVRRGFDGQIVFACGGDPLGLLRREFVPIPPPAAVPAPLR